MSCGFPTLSAALLIPSADLGLGLTLPERPDFSLDEDLGLPAPAFPGFGFPTPSADLGLGLSLPDKPDFSLDEDLGLPAPAFPGFGFPTPSVDLGLGIELPSFEQLPCPFEEAA